MPPPEGRSRLGRGRCDGDVKQNNPDDTVRGERSSVTSYNHTGRGLVKQRRSCRSTISQGVGRSSRS